jgi:CubicO group peptidase (beta-lactamase class C family)
VAQKSRIRNLLVLLAIGAGLIPIAVVGLFVYMNATRQTLHGSTDGVPSEMRTAFKTEWARSVESAEAIARSEIRGQNLPGISVAVGAGGDIVWAEGFGWANLEDKVRVAPETRFRIGTASTALTAAAAGLLIDQGKLKLDEEIQTYVPSFPKKEWPVKVRHLIEHTAGIGNDGGDEGPLFEMGCEKTADALKVFADHPLRFEPGTHYRYSSYGFILLSAAIENAAGEAFFTFVRRHVFEALGLNDTRIESGTDSVSGVATSYFPKFAADNKYGPDPMRPVSLSCYSGASAFVSTASDLVRFAMAINGGNVLKPETAALLKSSYDGALLGGRAVSLVTFPDSGVSVAVLSNTSYADTAGIAQKIGQIFASKGKKP